jgi:hypothetical protein
MKALIIIALVVLLVVFGPFATIWAMNTLFPALVIPYTFETWVAVVLLSSVLKSTVKVGK